MKKIIFIAAVLITGLIFVNLTTKTNKAENDFCSDLTQIVEAAKDSFDPLRGNDTAMTHRGVERRYNISKVRIKQNQIALINDNIHYPEFETNLIIIPEKKITTALKDDYDKYKELIKQCLPKEEWNFAEKDSSNNIYLEGTPYKKLIAIQKKPNENNKRIKLELYMYANMIIYKRVVELKVRGIGK